MLDRSRRLTAVAFVVLALVGAYTIAAPAGAREPALAENAAATRVYLTATNSFEEAELANLPRGIAAGEASAAQISSECPGVLTGAPPHEEVLGFGFVSSPSQPRPSARAEGERTRQARQLGFLKSELSIALGDAQSQPDREATATLLQALTPLRWSNPSIALLMHITLEALQQELDQPTPPVCADMKSWVASGYLTLSPASKEFERSTESDLKIVFGLFALAPRLQTLPKSLAPYENAADRALMRHIEALTAQLHDQGETRAETLKRLETTVGLPPAKKASEAKPKAQKLIVIGRGKTAAGGHFVAKAEPQAPSHIQRICTVEVTITETSHPSTGILELLSGEGTGRCLSRSHVEPEPAVHCKAGLLIVEAGLLPATRSVRLLLSNGRSIVSPAIRVPARLGGPAALYYQVVRGPSPIPVSLTELSASGSTLAVLKLPAVVECTKHLVKYFRDGIVRLVHESPPQTPAFTIRAERYRKLGAIHFELKLETSAEEMLFVGGSGSSFESNFAAAEEQTSTSGVAVPIVPNGDPQFEPSASSGCLPQPYVILYGLLKAPRDTVLARVSGKLVELPKVAIPAHLHVGGVLVYGALSPLPTELVIRDPNGRTLHRRDLTAAAQTSTETCEGEAEG
jgi:hypothetical protein